MKENYSRPTVINSDMSKFLPNGIIPAALKIIVNSLIRLSARPISKKDGLKDVGRN